ncbi:kinase-like domain-containing protein [Multifurca ochricompacta]|uniref:Kinase-like domain-containing protein n=1 Tax=Multifurca ochricompacta TaxID=376703 RepID=A0AAD4M2S6_9AGAM|nr:kinase-like domain-containing protein [Multifurca ochricompacta]
MAFLDYRPPGAQPGDIDDLEIWWVERQEALQKAGYMLRSRYRPGWKPSWAGTDKFYLDFEDGQTVGYRLGMDATRISDGKPVMLKRLLNEEGPYELEMNRLFSSEPLSSNPRNHCVQLLDIIELPNDPPIMVHPLLRRYYDPRFQTFGEFISFFAQTCEGVHFMHENHVAHRDCTSENIMLDPSNMFPESFHPADIERSRDYRGKAKWYSRTRRPTRYILIDFGLTRRYDPADGQPLDNPLRGGDKTAPEHQDGKTPCNPFPTDVYYLGNLIREDYIQVRILYILSQRYHGFEFIEPLVADMVQEDPTKRPTMKEVVTRFAEIRSKLSTWKLRSRMVRNNELWPVAAWRAVSHWYRTIGYVLARKAAIPEPE